MAALLTAHSISWLDGETARAADDPAKELQRGVHPCAAALVVLSPHFLDSTSCYDHFSVISQYRKPIIVLPLPGVARLRCGAGRCAELMHDSLIWCAWLAAATDAPPPEAKLMAELADAGVFGRAAAAVAAPPLQPAAAAEASPQPAAACLRALIRHIAASGFAAEADSALCLAPAARASPPLAAAARRAVFP